MGPNDAGIRVVKNLKIQTEPDGRESADLGEMIGRAKHELEHMVDMHPQIMLLTEPDGRIVRANRALLDMLGGRSFQEILGRNVVELFDCGDPRFLPRLLDRSDGGGKGDAIVTLPNRGAHSLHFEIIRGGDIGLRVLIVEDVTANKDREARLASEHRRSAVRELVGALMHTINQHLTVIGVRSRLLTMALDRPRIDVEDMRKGLDEISGLTLKIAETLSRVGKPQDYETVEYIAGNRIMDLDRPIPES
jgi:transcriptional regulator with PAS, ATPase and Fis domain